VWRQEHVVDVRDAAFSVRTYREQQDVRGLLVSAVGAYRREAACEVGAGYGRMTVVLTEFFDRVEGFERESHFVEDASRLLPEIRFHQVDALAMLPASDAAFDCVMTFTVLQHLTDPVARAVAGEIARILRPGGVLLICEETDPGHRDGAVDDEMGMCTIGRTVAEYAALFGGFTLLQTRPRRIEPTYPRPDVGAYMVFAKAEPAGN
jgi:SAM-dependent methyltransferase